MLQLINNAINFVYPNVCAICGKITEEGLCKKCEIKHRTEFFSKIDNYEIDNSKIFNEHIYFSCYNGKIREKIIEYKFSKKSYLNKFFCKIILKNEKMYVHLKKYDIIMPVPIHKKRKRERGYNQSELIAVNISKKLGIPLQNKVLFKIQNTVPQSTLTKKQRTLNIQGAYKAKKVEQNIGKTVLLVDDVYTTGSTLNECAKALKKVGIKNIGVLTISKD